MSNDFSTRPRATAVMYLLQIMHDIRMSGTGGGFDALSECLELKPVSSVID